MRDKLAKLLGGLVLLGLSGLISNTSFGDSQFNGIGDLPGGIFFSQSRAVSADGLVVVGESRTQNGTESIRWTIQDGIQGIGTLPGGTLFSTANGVSADGAVVVGLSQSNLGLGAGEAYRWTESDGMVGLGGLNSDFLVGNASAVSGNGEVIVGFDSSLAATQAFRWSVATGIVSLGFGVALDISTDSSVIVGESGGEAFLWTSSGGMFGLGDLPGGGFSSSANAVSADGTVVVGSSASADGIEAFRWTAADGIVSIGSLAGGSVFAQAFAVSANGNIIVGRSESVDGLEAFIWDVDTGMRSLKSFLVEDIGLDLTGWFLEAARDISDDGRVIVGEGLNPNGDREGWVAILDQTVRVEIDIKPGSDPNSINPASKGFVSLAVLTTSIADGDGADFNVLDVDPATLAFGPIGAPIARPAKYKDLDEDGDDDLILHFKTSATGIACGDTEGLLTGQTFDGQAITGMDAIKTVPCH